MKWWTVLVALLVTALVGCSGGPGYRPGGDDDDDDDDDDVVGGEGEGEGEVDGDGVGAGTDEPFTEDHGDGILIHPDGSMSIGQTGAVDVQPLIWVANSSEGTVSKIDTRTHVELGRYKTGDDGGQGGFYLNPSRTAVNRDGHVVVANRGFTSATRILAGNCPDRNGDGVVRTSTGGADVLPWGQDECAHWFTSFGTQYAAARGTIVEERGGLDGVYLEYAWVGAYSDMVMYEIATADGSLTGRTVNVSPVYPYGAALAADGKVWVCGGMNLAAYDTTTLAVEQYVVPNNRSTYGITIDADGNVWTGGSIQRYNPTTGQWDWPPINNDPNGFGMSYAGGIAADVNGYVWAAMGLSGGGINRINTRDLNDVTFVTTGGQEHGVAPDADGFIWGIDFVGTTASIIDPDTLAVERLTPPFNGAYTYSDMTGSQASLQTGGFGRYRHVFEGCAVETASPTEWHALDWNVRAPAGSHITFVARTGDDPGALAPPQGVPLATVEPDQPPVDILSKLMEAGVESGRYLELEVSMYSDDGATLPIVFSFGAAHTCPGWLE
jgi:hypothetical protein